MWQPSYSKGVPGAVFNAGAGTLQAQTRETPDLSKSKRDRKKSATATDNKRSVLKRRDHERFMLGPHSESSKSPHFAPNSADGGAQLQPKALSPLPVHPRSIEPSPLSPTASIWCPFSGQHTSAPTVAAVCEQRSVYYTPAFPRATLRTNVIQLTRISQ